MPPPARAAGSAALVVPPTAIAVGAVALGGLWLFDLLVLRTPWLTSFHQHRALTPLYAFAIPVVRWQAVGFVLAAAAFVAAAAALVSPGRVGQVGFAGALFAAAVVLPLALFVVRQDPLELGSAFLVYPREEFYADAARIGALGPFVARYVELMPQLSLHGQVYPPGYAVLLYGVRALFGTSMLAAGATVLICFAVGVVLAWLALATLTDERAARQGALLLLACPSLLDFACTAMDAVFFAVAALAWWLGLRAVVRDGPLHGVAAGLALLVASCFSFGAFPLGLALVLFALVRGWRTPRRTAIRLCGMGGMYVAAALALWAVTGFSIARCLLAARVRNVTLMTAVVGRDPATLAGRISYGNLVAYAIGAGLALVTPAAMRQWRRGWRLEPWTVAAVGTLLVMGLGRLYVMETERNWLFAMPWLAAIAVTDGPLEGSMRWLLGAGLAQAMAMEMALFTIW